MADGFDVDVYLYQPAGAGVQIANTPAGPVPLPVPYNEYKGVRELSMDLEHGWVQFTKRDGSRISSNAVFVVVETPKPASEA